MLSIREIGEARRNMPTHLCDAYYEYRREWDLTDPEANARRQPFAAIPYLWWGNQGIHQPEGLGLMDFAMGIAQALLGYHRAGHEWRELEARIWVYHVRLFRDWAIEHQD